MGNLVNYFNTETKDDTINTIGMLEKFLTNDYQVFILKGYAGTGKTTLMKNLIDYLGEHKKPYSLMASTGRAAMVLENKTLQTASTIHSKIYKVERIDENDEFKTIVFKLKRNDDHQDTIYIVDEASMITDKPSLSTFLNYGDGRLLAHIFSFIQNRKIIFVGDHAQLPPVQNKFSAALTQDYVENQFSVKVQFAELKKVWRQKSQSGILYNAQRLRFPEIQTSMLPVIQASGFDDIVVCYQESDLVNYYLKIVRQHGFMSGVILSLSNKQVLKFNQMVRQHLFPGKITAIQGDWLMIVANSYTYNLVNGQNAEIVEMDFDVEKRANVTFRNVTIKTTRRNQQQLINCKIIEDLLYTTEPNLSVEQLSEMMKDFAIRMRHRGISAKDRAYEEMFLTDPYLNALRVKFGYAITCHKAQGGEWPNVLLQLEYALSYFDLETAYRWIYTAVTRASEKLYILKNKMVI